MLIVLFLSGIVFLGGCETTKGLAEGTTASIVCPAKGAAQDAGSLWDAVLKLDQWIRKNFW
jgi:hypothetical protein